MSLVRGISRFGVHQRSVACQLKAVARITPPLHLPGATEFSADRDLFSPVWLVKTLKQTSWLYRDLEEATRLDKNWGRHKEPGSWALVYFAFVFSGQVDIEPWWKRTSDDVWRECGFAVRPSYQTTWERFVELESVADEFKDAANRLIQHARKHDPNVGVHLHVDGTEAETHAALVHDCQPGDGCRWQPGQPGAVKRPERVDIDKVRHDRHRESENAPEDEPTFGKADEVKLEDGRLRVKMGGHWYRSLDTSAGIRSYRAGKCWHGFYNQKAIDHYTGAPIAVGVYSASTQEYHCYPDLFARVQAALGGNPETVVADRGFSVASVFALNTNNGVASVMPWRRNNHHHDHPHDEATHDRDGIPRCKHCGAESKFLRFRVDRSGPRLWFTCVQKTTADCQRAQSLTCSKDWRLLNPLWRTDPIYHELWATHSNYERVHYHWRERYKVAGDNLANRPKRRGLAWQELRAQAALAIEWFCIAFRQGWLGSARRNQKAATRYIEAGAKSLDELLKRRALDGLTKWYGAAAEALGIGQQAPPSRRAGAPPGAPPGKPPDPEPF